MTVSGDADLCDLAAGGLRPRQHIRRNATSRSTATPPTTPPAIAPVRAAPCKPLVCVIVEFVVDEVIGGKVEVVSFDVDVDEIVVVTCDIELVMELVVVVIFADWEIVDVGLTPELL